MNISRRTAIKAIGAAMMAPCVSLRPEIDRERLLLNFCGSKEFRWDLSRPFGVGELTYATDQVIMVRAEIGSRIENGQRKLPCNIEEIWGKFWHPGEFVPWELPPIESLKLRPDQRCGGTCPLCDDRRISFGNSYPDEATMHDLAGYDVDDNTYRDPSCILCHGKDYYGPCEIEVRGVRMCYSRMKTISTLPRVMVAANQTRDMPLLFKSDGFEGMAMGVWRDSK